MGSIMMHLYISEKIMQKYKFDNNFLIGSVLPDIYKKTTMDRSTSHYLMSLKEDDNTIIEVPDLDGFINKNKQKNQDEITLGYFAHLVEDYIWFRYFSSKFVKVNRLSDSNEEIVTYAPEQYKHMHLFQDYKNDIYNDYAIWDEKLYKSMNFDIEKLKNDIKQYLNNPIYDEVVDTEMVVHQPQKEQGILFLSDELLQRYVKTSLETFDIEYKKFQNVT